MTKKDVIQLLEKIATYMELKGENTFKVSAYRKAAQSLEIDERPLDDIKDVTELRGIGKGVGDVINEYRDKGESSTLKAPQEEVPEGLVPLLKFKDSVARKSLNYIKNCKLSIKKAYRKLVKKVKWVN